MSILSNIMLRDIIPEGLETVEIDIHDGVCLNSISHPSPRPSLLDPSFVYTSVYTSGADVQATWRKFGWKPTHEAKND